MRIAINLLFVRSGEIGGSETFVNNLVFHLLRIDRKNKYTLIVAPYNKKSFLFDGADYLEFKFRRYSQAKRVFAEQVILPGKLKERGIDLLVNLGNTGLAYCPCKSILTIQDLLYLTCPGEYSWVKRAYLNCLIRRSCAYADKIAAVSENTKNDILRYLGVREDKVTVIYEGVNFERFANADKEKAKKILPQKYGINTEYLYSPVSLFPRKNIDLLISAFALLKKEKKIPHKLVLSGVDPCNRKEWLKKIIRDCAMENEVIYLGVISDYDVPYLYKMASLTAYLSSYEGFGLPILEAMASGSPVLSSDKASLPEVVGDAGVLVDPFNIREVSNKMYSLLVDVKLRDLYIAKGLSRASLFPWENAATRLMGIYDSL